ncbi:MAG: 3-keto-5-aminohexanoate cleavage enzyme [Actinomycetota bacterium]|nr:3-keto-5-aminohexanoate cleavage enzyme [Actinomycetota bacterium]
MSGRDSLSAVDACIITCALSGVAANREQCPGIPYTPEEYAAEAKRAFDAGASVVHIHARYPDGRPSFRIEEYRDITLAILDAAPNLVINLSTGAIGVPIEQRVHQITALKPEIGALNMGSMNYAKYSSKRKSIVFDFVFANPFGEIMFLLEQMNDAGVKPECECFDTGHIGNVSPLIDMGLMRTPIQFSLILGVLGGAPADARTLAHMASLLPAPSTWEVIAISRKQWEMVAAAASLGGNVRVGLEDNFYLPSGEMAPSNGALVEAAASLVQLAGRRVATPAEARAALTLPDPPDRSAVRSWASDERVTS